MSGYSTHSVIVVTYANSTVNRPPVLEASTFAFLAGSVKQIAAAPRQVFTHKGPFGILPGLVQTASALYVVN